MISSASTTTDAYDVSALQDMYRTLSFPPQLTGWKTKGGDPCGELWKGVSCDGSSILYIKLNGLDLGGYLGEQLNLMNLKQLDLSSNHIQGAIPSLLPPNATNIDLSCNDLNMSIPYTLTSMKHLCHLNFSHNALSGPIGNVFTGLHNLKQIDYVLWISDGDSLHSFSLLEEGEQIHDRVRLIPELIHGMYAVSVIIFGHDIYIYQEYGERAEVPSIIHFTNIGAVDLHEGLNGIGIEITHSPHPLDSYCIAGGQGIAVGPHVRTPADMSEINFANNPIHLLKVNVHGGFAEYVEEVICSNGICVDYFAFVLEDAD